MTEATIQGERKANGKNAAKGSTEKLTKSNKGLGKFPTETVTGTDKENEEGDSLDTFAAIIHHLHSDFFTNT